MRHLDLRNLHQAQALASEPLTSAVLVDLDSIACTEPLNDWSLQAWKSTFNELLVRFIRADGTSPLLFAYTRERSWDRAQTALKLGARDLCHFDELVEKLKTFDPSLDEREAPVRLPLRNTSVPREGPNDEGPRLLPKNAIPFPISGLEGESRAIEAIRDLVRKCAPMDTSVLIAGPSGSGKERVAKAIHQHSERSRAPWVVVHCASLNPNLMESELFGHVAGAFTSADRETLGLIRSAAGGTLFFDEVAGLPYDLQAKLLRCLQERQITPVGGTQPISVDVRIVASTSQDLDELVALKRFRADLLYRLRVIDVRLPSLFERKSDLPILSQSILRRLSKQARRPSLELSTSAMEKILFHTWPGNVRELENSLEHGATLAWAESRSTIEAHDLPQAIQWASMEEPKQQLKDAVRRFEREYVAQTLRRLGGSKEEAAEILGLSLATLYRKLGS